MIAYLYSRWPVISQTFCDSEMLAHEAAGLPLAVATLYPPRDSFRHERLGGLRAPLLHPPPPAVLKAMEAAARADGRWPGEMVDRHLRDLGASFQPGVRARNALWLADRLPAMGVRHVHVHFANRATHTALFLKEIVGLGFSFTAHAQDFLVDLGSDALLHEMCREAAFVVAVSDYSRGILRGKFPDCADRMRRIYNGLRADDFPRAVPGERPRFRVVSIGRLIEFKGFHHLAAAMAGLVAAGVDAELRLIGEGPWRDRIADAAAAAGAADRVVFLGSRSQEEVKQELAEADAFALASCVDGKGATDILPTVITEAMACGLPVVSTRLAGIPEMVVDGKTGLLVEPGDTDALAGALDQLAGDPDLARRLGEAGARRAAEVFSLDRCAGELRQAMLAAAPRDAATAMPPPALWYLAGCNQLGADPLSIHAQGRNETRLLAVDAFPGRNPADGIPPTLDFLPDGIVLEATWRAEPEARRIMEALRHELGSAIDGEAFFRDARRALWIAREAARRGITGLHAGSAATAVTAWLARLLDGPPFTAVLEPGHAIDKRVVQRLDEAAIRTAGADGGDPLQLADPVPVRRRLGPVKWKTPPPEVDAAQQVAALEELLNAHAPEG